MLVLEIDFYGKEILVSHLFYSMLLRPKIQIQISTEAASGNLTPTDVSRKGKQIQPKADGCFYLNVI